jgi:hypothetical protein
MSRVASCLLLPIWVATGLPIWPALAQGTQAPAPAPLPSKYRAVAVLPLEFYDIDEEVVQGIEHAILNEIDEIPGLQAISPEDLRSDLHKYNLDIGNCERATACLASAGRYGRAHLVLEIRLSGLGGTQNIAVRLIDTQTRSEVIRLAEPLEEEVQARPQQLHRLAVQLLRPDDYVGSLTVICHTPGAEVYLDDFLLGATPLPTRDRIRAGLHVLRLSKPGYSDINRFVDVIYNRSSPMVADFGGTDVSVAIVKKISDTGFGELWVVTTEAGLEMRVDGEPVGMTPLQKAISQVPAGPRRLSFRQAGHLATVTDIHVKAGQRLDLRYEITDHSGHIINLGYHPIDAPLPTASSMRGITGTPMRTNAKRSWPTWRFYAGAGSGVVGLAALTAAVFYAHDVSLFSDEAAQIRQELQNDTFSAADYERLRLRLSQLNISGPHAQNMEWLMLGIGIAATGAGAGLIAWDITRDPSDDKTVALAPWWTGDGVGFVMRSQF